MTLREESGSGPPADRETKVDPQEPAATPAPAGDHDPPEGPDPGTGTASPGGPAHLAGSSSPSRAGSSPAGRRRSRAALLIGGSVAVCLAGLGVLATVLLLHARTHSRPPAPPPVFGLGVGECVNYGPGAIASPIVVPCRQPHDAEVYARFRLAGRHWPGTAAVGTQARQGCTARLSGYLNPQLATSVLAESYVFPNRSAWDASVRTVICEIRGTAGRLTGSVRGLG
jgi:Septum formation